jgi:methyl coenzyme M reductase alpha subunit
MAEPEYVVVYAAAYPNVAAAQAVLDTIEHLHKVGGDYDAAVIDKQNGKSHVVKRMDHPHIRVIPEWLGGGALKRKELNEAAEELLADEAGLIVVGEATIEPAFDKVFTGTPKVVKREIEATIDQITSELQQAFKD